jgi:peptidoglycan/LPS O-acetylase OafA/YrhL
MLAHSAWAQSLMVMGAAELGLARGKLTSRWWKLTTPIALFVSGAAFLVHEQNDWWFARSAFLHHLLGWTLVLGAIVPLLGVFRPRSTVLQSGLAVVLIALAVMLYCDRDVAPVFGHLSPLAGAPHR